MAKVKGNGLLQVNWTTKYVLPTYGDDAFVGLMTSEVYGETGGDTNRGGSTTISLYSSQRYILPSGHFFWKRRLYLHTPQADNSFLFLYLFSNTYWDGSQIADVYEVTGEWEEYAITWNNQPGYGQFLGSCDLGGTGWKIFNIGSAKSVCIRFRTEHNSYAEDEDSHGSHLSFRSADYYDSSVRPYYVA